MYVLDTIYTTSTSPFVKTHNILGIVVADSLKIAKLSNAEVYVIEGTHQKRKESYNRPEPYKIISYNSACNDIKVLGGLQTDMLIMDEDYFSLSKIIFSLRPCPIPPVPPP